MANSKCRVFILLNELPNSWVHGYKIGSKRNPMLEKTHRKDTLKHSERSENHDNFNVETFPLKSFEGPLRSRCVVCCKSETEAATLITELQLVFQFPG